MYKYLPSAGALLYAEIKEVISAMSSAINFLKKIDGYTPEAALESFQKAVVKAGMHCFGFEMYYDESKTPKGGEGALSEKDQASLMKLDLFDSQKEKTYLFCIKRPSESSYDSFTWLLNDPHYFKAIYINKPYEYDEGEFIFRFVVSYFEDNPEDYLWDGSAREDFYYTAADIKKLSTMPYNPRWNEEKLV